jgi:hypothetical protein
MGQISVYLQALAFMEYHTARRVRGTGLNPPEHVAHCFVHLIAGR